MNPLHTTIDNFCRMFDLTREAVEKAKNDKRLPDKIFSKDRGTLLINYKYVEKRIQFRRKMWLDSHELYYKLIDILPSDTSIARVMAKIDGDYSPDKVKVWNIWISQTMFMNLGSGLMLDPRPNDMKFTRYARWILSIHKKNVKKGRGEFFKTY